MEIPKQSDEEISTPFSRQQDLEISNRQWRPIGNDYKNAIVTQNEQKNDMLEQFDLEYDPKHFENDVFLGTFKESSDDRQMLANQIKAVTKPSKHTNQHNRYRFQIRNKKVGLSSKSKDTLTRKNKPYFTRISPKPKYHASHSTSTSSPNEELLSKTFGNGDRNTFRDKRNGTKLSIKKDPDSVGFTKFTMEGVDIHYSFPKSNPSKTIKRRKKQVKPFYHDDKETAPQNYEDYGVHHKHEGRGYNANYYLT